MNLSNLSGAELDKYAAGWNIERGKRFLIFKESDKALRARIKHRVKWGV